MSIDYEGTTAYKFDELCEKRGFSGLESMGLLYLIDNDRCHNCSRLLEQEKVLIVPHKGNYMIFCSETCFTGEAND